VVNIDVLLCGGAECKDSFCTEVSAGHVGSAVCGGGADVDGELVYSKGYDCSYVM
jgi:hypothetical protein